MAVYITHAEDVQHRIAQMTQALKQMEVWTDELFSWQAGLNSAAIEAITAIDPANAFVSGDGDKVKGFATECHQIFEIRAGRAYIPQNGPYTVGTGVDFRSWFNLVVGLGI